MKTKEFVKEVKALGYIAHEGRERIFITNNRDNNFAVISTVNKFGIDTDYMYFNCLEENEKTSLFNLIQEYAATPVDERKEEKVYRYKFPFRLAVTEIEKEAHLRKEELRKNLSFIVVDTSGVDFAKKHSDFHFTDKEVEQYTGKDRVLFDACEKIEITEDNQK